MQNWDTAGVERFRSLIPSYIRDSSVAVLIYDVTKNISFDSINQWCELVYELRGEECKMVIVGNKIDLESKRFT